MARVKLLLFDVDQTLVSTGGAGVRALNRAFERLFAIENAMDGILPHGKTDPAIVREIGISRQVDTGPALVSILENYLAFLDEEVHASSSYHVLPGVVRLLEQLSTCSEVMLGLATGNIETGARIKLERGNLNRFFEFGGFGSDSECRVSLVRRAAEVAASRRGRAFAATDVFVIGDTPLDIEAARGAGFNAVGVATGRFPIENLSGPDVRLTIQDFASGHADFVRMVGLGG
jgi:phosphoglycolate phosphatase-like HAD superfamily hydrolase